MLLAHDTFLGLILSVFAFHSLVLLLRLPVALRICAVSFVDHRGIRHTAEVEAESLYEAACLPSKGFVATPGLSALARARCWMWKFENRARSIRSRCSRWNAGSRAQPRIRWRRRGR